MEILVFAIVVSIIAIYGMWRVRRVGSPDEPDRATEPPPDDQRYQSIFPDAGMVDGQDAVMTGVPPQRPVSREEGHGKDGG